MTWRPFVIGTWGRPRAQKLAKLFFDTNAALCPSKGGFWPSSVVWITEGSMASREIRTVLYLVE
jgi:hypothetical protein